MSARAMTLFFLIFVAGWGSACGDDPIDSTPPYSEPPSAVSGRTIGRVYFSVRGHGHILLPATPGSEPQVCNAFTFHCYGRFDLRAPINVRLTTAIAGHFVADASRDCRLEDRTKAEASLLAGPGGLCVFAFPEEEGSVRANLRTGPSAAMFLGDYGCGAEQPIWCQWVVPEGSWLWIEAVDLSDGRGIPHWSGCAPDDHRPGFARFRPSHSGDSCRLGFRDPEVPCQDVEHSVIHVYAPGGRLLEPNAEGVIPVVPEPSGLRVEVRGQTSGLVFVRWEYWSEDRFRTVEDHDTVLEKFRPQCPRGERCALLARVDDGCGRRKARVSFEVY